MIRYLPLLLSGLLMQSPVSAEPQDVRGWLTAMNRAVHNLDYEGTFVYLHGEQLEAMRVIHTTDTDGERERLISLNGAAREVVRDSASVICVAPDARSVSVGRRIEGAGMRAVFSMDVDGLSRWYDFRLLGQTRVTGRQAQVVAILPRDHYRYGYRLFLDRDTALPLKTDLLGTDSRPISQIMFTSLTLGSAAPAVTEVSLEGSENYAWTQSRPARVVDTGDWEFDDLPPGFQVTLHARSPAGDGRPAVEHYILSDGLASASVYIERADAEEGWNGGSRMGAVNAYGRMVDSFQVTVVGSVPAVTVERIGQGTRWNGEP
ncbi:MAG TPA: transcriptional regulator [Sedimenticola thiotaurini]|uniref:Transcriptional regulator n=1 Tax=Sedimenticola thiotaurini TaxID=1543721 RepID=A0A831W9M7_9GAMM|nr:transcriptional regulator [Sedimenticola thiotaurini]